MRENTIRDTCSDDNVEFGCRSCLFKGCIEYIHFSVSDKQEERFIIPHENKNISVPKEKAIEMGYQFIECFDCKTELKENKFHTYDDISLYECSSCFQEYVIYDMTGELDKWKI